MPEEARHVVVGGQEVHEVRREGVDEADGQVDLAADEQQDLAERDDDDRRRVQRQDEQVRLRDERRAGHAK